jgi:O-antigen ligase
MPGFVENCNRIVRWGLLALIVFTPLAFGTVEDWSIALMEWGIVTLFIVFMAGRLWPAARRGWRGIWWTGLEWPLGLFLVFCLAQTVPLPGTWLTKISPGSARLFSTPSLQIEEPGDVSAFAVEGILSANRTPADASILKRPVSVRADRTLRKVMLICVFILLFFLVAWWADRGERIIYLVTAITTVGFLVALQALIQFMTWNGRILWLRPAAGGRAFGPFVNDNHFAGYVEMIIPVAIGLSLYLLDRRRHPPAQEPGAKEDLEAGEQLSIMESRVSGHREKGILVLFTAVILLVSLFFCMSKGGLLSSLVSGVVLLALLWKRMVSKRIAWAIILSLPILVVALVFWIGPAEVFEQIGSPEEMSSEASFRSRALVWAAMVRNVGEFAWAGSGLGTFREGFAAFTPPGSTARWHRAHNDYLQLFWETGAIGFSLFLVGTVVFARRYWWPALRSREHPLDVIRIGAAVSLMSIAVHSLIDFNLQIGSNGFLFALLAGLLAALTRSIETSGSDSRLQLATGNKDV